MTRVARVAAAPGTRLLDPEVVLCVMTAASLVAIVWALPRPLDDLFVGLAAGRDIVAGLLGTPDDWAFTTHGRVWLNQNWGTHLLSYVVYRGFGETGLLLQKALMLAATATFLVGACRARAVSLPPALLVAGAAIAAGRTYIDLRPNLSSIALTPLLLWILYRTAARPHRAWAAALVVWLWSNAHGGFVLGLALMALWAATYGLAVAIHENAVGRWSGVWTRCWPLAAATTAAALLAAFANPFGIANLTHPFIMATEPVWRNIDEWRPLFTSKTTAFGTAWEFVVVAALWIVALLARLRTRRRGAHRPDTSATALLVFDVVAGALVLAMAVQARRFVPLAILTLAPSIALQLDAALTGRRRRLLTVVLAAALLVPPALLVRPLVMRYRSDNPLYDRETMLQRMLVVSLFFPTKAADFVRANRLGGAVLNAYEWEGFLRWRETGLRFFVGSRAQQVYDAATYRWWLRLLHGDASSVAELATLDVHLAIIPMTAQYDALLSALVYVEDAHWVYIYCDGRHVLLADTASDETADLRAAAARGSLSYPDDGVRALSRAFSLASPGSHAAPEAIRDALQAALAERPNGFAYAALGDLALNGQESPSALIPYFEAEKRRLAAMDASGAGGAAVVETRQWNAAVLASLYRAVGRVREAELSESEAQGFAAELARLKTRWGAGDTPGFS